MTSCADGVAAEGLGARRGYATLFANLQFSVMAGCALTVTGANGSGKTTLLRIIAGLTAPVEGEIRWQGQAMRPFDRRMREAVAFNGHLPALKDELSAEDNLRAWIALDDRSPDADAVVEALDAVALARQRRLPVRVLSQGQRRRIGLARLRLVRRPLWVLDEPLTALDADGVDALGALLDAHLAGGGVCIAASHHALPIPRERARSLALGPARE
ncbi:MAG TPA: cytochrome c biogenesis heme-transporting ATPase CcmA [Casimicrobiaceae bacterium]|nr:cytochrome c biogenesis heme-transporting ATPase CcmA [Casimicrobiaceae bacterium]HXU66988.1 cytochrome c biogenesis heme-transporting ATPase CcmA [Casimicrobiaceae bacterium]